MQSKGPDQSSVAARYTTSAHLHKCVQQQQGAAQILSESYRMAEFAEGYS